MTSVYRALIAAGCVASFSAPASAQLRPLDPVDFRSFTGEPFRLQVGLGVYFNQEASLAGTQGTLWELGDLQTSLRTGRMVVELSGTLRRNFYDHAVIDEPYGGAHPPPPDGKRIDAGDYRVSTILRLTDAASPTLAMLRFGTRLPTTDNRVGLDRDETDFFATLGAHTSTANFSVGLEAGISINGTREANYEQSDVLVYGITSEGRFGEFAPFLVIVGQKGFYRRVIRGNEDLGELRAGLRLGGTPWLNAAWVRGFSDASPTNGLQVSVGAAFGR